MAKFSEVLTIVNGRNQKQVVCDDGKYPIYGSGGIMGYANDYICKAETVVIGRKGSINKPIFVETPFWNVDTAFGLCANSEKLNSKYLYYFCEKFDFEKLNTTVTIPSLTKSNLLNVDIPLPNLEKQKQIVELLDKVTSLIFLRKQQLSKLDELVKARFVEMFGDPIRNDKHFVQKTGKSLFCFSSGKFFQEEKRFQHGFPVYGGNGITWYTDIPLVKKPTIIIGRVGAYCGNVRMVNVPVWITDNAIYIKEFKTRELNLHFLLMLMKYMKFSNYADYSGQPKITQKPLETLIYIVPPLELQNRFAAFVERVDQQKQTVQQSLEKLELMKKALMQEYFG